MAECPTLTCLARLIAAMCLSSTMDCWSLTVTRTLTIFWSTRETRHFTSDTTQRGLQTHRTVVRIRRRGIRHTLSIRLVHFAKPSLASLLTSLSVGRSTVLGQRPTLTHRTLWRRVQLHLTTLHSSDVASTSDAVWPSIRRVFFSEKHSHDFSKKILQHNRKYAFHFLESIEPQTPLYPMNSTSFANVLTPPSVHHQYACVLAFHKHFVKGVRLAYN